MNPLLSHFHTLHNSYPYSRITVTHIEEAVGIGMRQEKENIERIAGNPEPPTFQNTIIPLETSGEILERSTTLMYNLLSAERTDELQAVSERVAGPLAEHHAWIFQNQKLFERVRHVREKDSHLDAEEKMLVEHYYECFERSGATLTPEKRKRFLKITSELSELSIRFSSHLLKETNAYSLHLTDRKQLSGLPETVCGQAAQQARERQLEGWVFTLQAPSYVPFMSYADDRELRRQMYVAYQTRCSRHTAHNNEKTVRRMVNLRREKANLLGFPDYATYVLRYRMARTPERVMHLLDELCGNYLPKARQEVQELKDYAHRLEGSDFELQAWDFSYYAQKLKKERYDFDAEALRPYFELNQVVQGVFGLATRLYGLTFREQPAIEVYHPDVKAYEVLDADGQFLAVLYADFFPRETKQGGAWMTHQLEQREGVRPHVSLVTNFPRPTAQTPSLLTLDEVETFLHEFGHTLHGMMAHTRFASLSGTNVLWDFVELPSQFMENFALEKDFLRTFAKHHQTHEPIPDSYLENIVRSRNFQVGWACVRQLSFGYLDMSYHMRRQRLGQKLEQYEEKVMEPVRLLPRVPGACMAPHFSHIMSGGYAAGYYSYKWAEVLEADAFSAFRAEGVFNETTAKRFRKEILERGGTEHPDVLFRNFMGREPSIHALLERDGIPFNE